MSRLILTRRPGEEIVIGGNIKITVVAVHGNQVRLSIDAPPEIRVDRREIAERRLMYPDGHGKSL